MLACIPVHLPVSKVDWTPRLKPDDIKPELFILGDQDHDQLDKSRVSAFHNVCPFVASLFFVLVNE